MPPRKPPKTAPPLEEEVDDELEDEPDDETDDDEDDDVEDGDDDDDDSEEDDSDSEGDAPEDDDDKAEEDDDDDGASAARSPRARARGVGGMGRPSTGPPVRRSGTRSVAEQSPSRTPRGRRVSASAASTVEPLDETPVTELAPDISQWPGTAEAARQVSRHPSTIKLWRTQGRIRATQDAAGCWRHHPDDLAEAIDTPDQTDPGSVLASGMSAIVQQGASANERLLAMTEIATDGLKDATTVLSKELERAYKRIAELEEKVAELKDKHAATHADDLKHERHMRRLDQKHAVDIVGAQESSRRIEGLLTIVGPIAASIGARLLGDIVKAESVEAKVAGVPGAAAATSPAGAALSPLDPKTPSPFATPTEDRLVPTETRLADAMGRLCAAIRLLDKPAFAGLRAMLPPNVAAALDDVAKNESDSVVGRALAIIIKAAQNLSDLQFRALQPIAPADVAAVLAELRELLQRDERSSQPAAD